MYYKNRTTFYLRNFGSKILIIAILAVIFLFGTYSYINAAHITPKSMMASVKENTEIKIEKADNKVVETAKKENVNKETTTETKKVEDKKKQALDNKDVKLRYTSSKNVLLKDLKQNKVSGAVKVVEVIDTNKIVVEDMDSTKYTVNLIGVTGLDETKYSREGIIANINNLNNMLKSNFVQIEFDKNRQGADDSINAYVYFNKGLLNADLLAQGYCDIKVENENTNRIGDLLLALKKAKSNKVGIWQ